MKANSLFFLILLISCGKQTGLNGTTDTRSFSSDGSLKICGGVSYKNSGFFIEDTIGEYFIIGENQEVRNQLNQIGGEERSACAYSSKFGNYDGLTSETSGQSVYVDRLDFL